VKREFSEKEAQFFVNVDFVNHVALIAVVEEDGKPVIGGGGRYIVVSPGQAEVAFAVVDKYHGQGMGTTLMRHLGDYTMRLVQRMNWFDPDQTWKKVSASSP
jgi:GNAT superfamily N-acetyltransferase